MKKAIICGIIIIIAILAVFGYLIVNDIDITNKDVDDELSAQMLTISKGGVVIQYPSDWGYSKATSNHSLVAISKLDSIDSSGVGQININIEKEEFTGDFLNYLNNTYNSIGHDSSFDLVSSGESTFNGQSAMVYVYTSNVDGQTREHKAIWFERGNEAYVILYSAPQDEFDTYGYVADYIAETIQF